MTSTSSRAVIVHSGKLLVEWLPAKSISFLPGGTVEAGESLTETLERELSEELGTNDFEIREYLGSIEHHWLVNNVSFFCLNHFFAVDLSDNTAISAEAGRHYQWRVIDAEGLRDLQPPSLRSVVLAEKCGLWNLVDNWER